MARRLASCRPALLPALAAAMLWSGSPVPAQTVYRCGNAANVYTQHPCPEGRVVDVSDARGASQLAEAEQLRQRERRLADRLAADRRAREAANRVGGPVGAAMMARRKPPAARASKDAGEPARVRVALVPGSGGKSPRKGGKRTLPP